MNNASIKLITTTRAAWYQLTWPTLRKIGTAQHMRTDNSIIGQRAEMHAVAKEKANARGFFTMIENGRDCDGYSYSHYSHHNIACMRGVEKAIQHAYDWAEGPVYCTFHKCDDDDMRMIRSRRKFQHYFTN